MYVKINESIETFVQFTKKGLSPICFAWKNRDYNVEEVSFIHQSKEGNQNLVHFSVSSEASLFKITFNTKTLSWTLDEIYSDGFLK